MVNDFDGEAAEDLYGHSVCMSGDAVTIAISARNNEGSGTNAGHVRVFGLEDFLTNIELTKEINFNIYPNPTFNEIFISLENQVILQQALIYNQRGQLVKTTKENRILVSDLNTGIYFIEVKTDQGNASKKIIIE